jgi:hypothetical protein
MYLSCLFYFSLRKCDVTSRKYALKQGNRIGVRFIKHDIQVSQKNRLSLKVRHLEVLWSPEMLERVHGNIVKRAIACLDANGQNFEHLF